MDPNAANIDPERIKGIYNFLTDALIEGVEKGEISEDDERESAEYVLQNLDSVKTQTELVNFLEQLCKSWPSYKSAYHKIINEQKLTEDQKKISEIENSINNITSSN
jgi:hypothetical protein